MDKDKSILEKFTDVVKDIASTATEAASQALKADEPELKGDERLAYVPLAGDGLVSDPLMVPPLAAAPPPRKRVAKARRTLPVPRRGKQGPEGCDPKATTSAGEAGKAGPR